MMTRWRRLRLDKMKTGELRKYLLNLDCDIDCNGCAAKFWSGRPRKHEPNCKVTNKER